MLFLSVFSTSCQSDVKPVSDSPELIALIGREYVLKRNVFIYDIKVLPQLCIERERVSYGGFELIDEVAAGVVFTITAIEAVDNTAAKGYNFYGRRSDKDYGRDVSLWHNYFERPLEVPDFFRDLSE